MLTHLEALRQLPRCTELAKDRAQWSVRCLQKGEATFRGVCVTGHLPRLLALRARSELAPPHRLLLRDEGFPGQPHPQNTRLWKAGRMRLRHVRPSSEQGVKWTLLTRLGFYANKFEENAS